MYKVDSFDMIQELNNTLNIYPQHLLIELATQLNSSWNLELGRYYSVLDHKILELNNSFNTNLDIISIIAYKN